MILDKTYREFSAVSNSSIKDFQNDGPKLYFDKYIDPTRVAPAEFSTESTDIGDLTDVLVTAPESFDKFYYVSGDVKGSADFKLIVTRARQLAIEDLMRRNPTLKPEELPMDEIKQASSAGEFLLQAAKEAAYRSNYKDDTLRNYMIENGGNYYYDLSTAGDRRIIDMTTHTVAQKAVRDLKENDITGPVLATQSGNGIEVFKQQMVTVTIKGLVCKILIDFNVIDHNRKWIYPKDIKTALSHKQFRINYIKFGYGNQGSFYTGVLKAAYPDYSIAPFEFIVCCTESGEDPMIYRMTPQELGIFANGVKLKSGREIQGWLQTLDLIKWHTDNAMWRYPKDYYDNSYLPIVSYSDESIESMGDGAADSEDMF